MFVIKGIMCTLLIAAPKTVVTQLMKEPSLIEEPQLAVEIHQVNIRQAKNVHSYYGYCVFMQDKLKF